MAFDCSDGKSSPTPSEHSPNLNQCERETGSLNSQEESGWAAMAIRKNGSPKESAHYVLYAINKSNSQIKKPPHRKNASPMNWFPRKKTASFLERKIKQLQEIGGMNSTLDETLGHANPHYSKVEREKIAARAAANRAMEARKAAMAEASWCRILRAARINCKNAELLLAKAEKNAEEAFQVASAMGIVMYDKAGCPRRPLLVETSSTNDGGSSTHTITASFETAFEVDKEVAAAVKMAFIRLISLPQFLDMDEASVGGDTLHKISQDLDECESQRTGTHASELADMMVERLRVLKEEELASIATIVVTCGLNAILEVEDSSKHMHATEEENGSYLGSLESCLVKHVSKLERGVQEAKNSKNIKVKALEMDDKSKRKHATEIENCTYLGSLESCLVKHVSNLEREVQEAKNARNVKDDVEKTKGLLKNKGSSEHATEGENGSYLGSLESCLVKHVSKLERGVQEAKNSKNIKEKALDMDDKSKRKHATKIENCTYLGSLESCLVKHVSNLEREVQEAKNARNVKDDVEKTKGLLKNRGSSEAVPDLGSILRRKHSSRLEKEIQLVKTADEHHQDEKVVMKDEHFDKENLDSNQTREEINANGLYSILVKHVHHLEKDKMQSLASGKYNTTERCMRKPPGCENAEMESLDKVLVKHVSRLERDRIAFSASGGADRIKSKKSWQDEKNEKGLGDVLVKHLSRIEKEKKEADEPQTETSQANSLSESHISMHLEGDRSNKSQRSLKEERMREMQEAWGGLSLGNSIKPHISRLERDKAAWTQAEEEEAQRHAAAARSGRQARCE